ncbi:MAG: Rab family GTPase [Thermofilaceae archaeon]
MKAFKIVMCGDGGVGKTSLVSRFIGSPFNPMQKLTVGVSHHVRELPTNDGPIKLIVWDLGGEERFRFLAPVFLKGARGAVFVFDVTREETFEHLEDWLTVVLDVVGDLPRVLVGNKVDMTTYRVIPRERAEDYATRRGFLAYFETSAKDGANTDVPFLALAEFLSGVGNWPQELSVS